MKIQLTKTAIDAIPTPGSGQVLYYDTKLSGFGLRVSPAKKVFFAERKVAGKTVRSTIGRYGVFTLDQAKEAAKEKLSRMALGENLNEQKKVRRQEAEEAKKSEITLGDAFKEYIRQRTSGQGRELKPRTVEGYEWMRDKNFADWLDLPVGSITETMVRERHAQITRDAGPYGANGAFRVLRTILIYTRDANKRPDGSLLFPNNPVEVLTRLKLWNEEKRKTRFVASDQLDDWFDAVEAIDPSQFRHALQTKTLLYVMMFLGFRVTEAKSIRLSEVETDPPCLRLIDTKNGDEHYVPMGPFLAGNVEALRDAALAHEADFLFFSDESESGHMYDPRKVIKEVREQSGIVFSPHDLRRTFVTMLNTLEPAPSMYTIKRLMNHRAKPSDVTAGYIQHEEKRLREHVTRLEEWILSCAGRAPTGQRLKKPARQTTETTQSHQPCDSRSLAVL